MSKSNSYESTYKQHTPQQTNFGMFDPQAFETHINNPHSFEKLIVKLANLESQPREPDMRLNEQPESDLVH